MNSTTAISSSSLVCHPERSLSMSEANRHAESKDPVPADSGTGNARDFRIVVRFLDEGGCERRHLSSREAAAWESPARKCRVRQRNGASPEGTAALTH
jgi:hypothetical protein